MKNRLREMSWVEFNRCIEMTDMVIIPTGAIEGYGPHMPLGTDIIVVEEVARKVADITGALVGPSIDVGESSILRAFPGSMTVSEENFKWYVRDICESLRGWGFKKFLFITGHSGNVPMIDYICKEYRDKYPEIQTMQVDWWRFAMVNDGNSLDNTGYMAHGHASECGTSVMLYLRPELVDMNLAIKQEIEEKYYNSFKDIIQYTSINNISDSGVIGDATSATVEKGEKIVNACIGRIVEYIKNSY
ncbi:creatinine amidohydrolase [Dethiosulfatibacter aminovorans DSM 17477]|uniref:Creatinine amidohydrolase n=1 Tax=Dethiosulfatibacter aminovorans DSM 17477 TaxID=1121476 RepID=A0A1M6DS28_9FIRM|nr:creatininase family protein [Dethiosulfatibacter aminovorans]SHI75818.1 creatinine amidohydrolase [Dethiosulfatibacter aminovorans DSM 17477]